MKRLWRFLFGESCRMHTTSARFRSELCPRCNALRALDREGHEGDIDVDGAVHIRRVMDEAKAAAIKVAPCVLLLILAGCASVPKDDPTRDHPRTDGCIVPTLKERSQGEGRRLAEKVLVIGTTPLEDGERWMVVRGPEWNFDEWQPWAHDAITFGAQCSDSVGLQ
jgi:hypothetical protein